MVTMKDVATKAGVSASTVSHVINKTRFVSEDVVHKVEQAMLDLNYRPNSIARSLRSKQSRIIGYVSPLGELEPFSTMIAHGIEKVLNENGFHMILCNTMGDNDKQAEIIRMLNAQFIDGLILFPHTIRNDKLESLQFDYPVVFIDSKPDHVDGDCVYSDYFDGMYKAASHLIAKGHRQIGMIRSDLHVTPNIQKLKGYYQALEHHGIPIDESLVKAAPSSIRHGYQIAKEFIEAGRVTALILANHLMMIGTVKYIQEQKIRMPADLAIIGVEEYEWMEILSPRLSVIKQSPTEMGETAATVLLDKIKNPDKPNQDYIIPTEFVPGETC